MAIPTYELIMLPLLKLGVDGGDHRLRDTIEKLAEEFHLTLEERTELLPSGGPKFNNRVAWARTALKKAGLLDAPQRAFFRITERGREVLLSDVQSITDKYLLRFPEYCEYKGLNEKQLGPSSSPSPYPLKSTETETPRERLESSYSELSRFQERDLLSKVKGSSPSFFEMLVVKLLVKMGYGGSLLDAGSAIGRSGDGGIDGIIKEDELGLDMIYIQAKRYTTANVPAADVRDFVGALVGMRARKGVLFTTSGFSDDARRYAQTIEGKTLVLIDGNALASLMLKYEIGFTVTDTYKVGRIDEDYFDEEDSS